LHIQLTSNSQDSKHAGQASNGRDAPPRRRGAQHVPGHERKSRKPWCKHCKGVVGHKGSECPKGRGVAAALRALDEAKGIPLNTDQAPPKQEDIKLSKEELNAQGCARIEKILTAKAVSLFLTKDLDSLADRKVVLRALANLASSENITNYTWPKPNPKFRDTPSVGDVIMDCMERGLHQAYDARRYFAKRNYVNDDPDSRHDDFELMLKAVQLHRIPALLQEDLLESKIDKLSRMERTKLWSSIEYESHQKCFYWALVACSIAFMAILEEGARIMALLYLGFWGGVVVSLVFAAMEWKGFATFRRSVFVHGFLLCLQHLLLSATCEAASKFLYRFVSIHGLSNAFLLNPTIGRLSKLFDKHEGALTIACFALGPVASVFVSVWTHVIINIYCFYCGYPLFNIFDRSRVYWDLCLEYFKIKRVKVQPDAKVSYGQHVCEEKFGTRRFFGVEGIFPVVHRQCMHNEKISLEARVFKFLPIHENMPLYVGRWRELARRIIPQLVLLIPKVRRRCRLSTWFASFPPAKRDKLRMLYDNVLKFIKSTTLRAKSFIKRETALRSEATFGLNVEKDPRMIQGCPEELSILTGPYVRKMAKGMRDGLMPDYTAAGVRSGKQIVYTCGLSGEEIGMAFHRAIKCIGSMLIPGEQIVFVEDDESRFDLHLTEGPFSYLARLYARLLPRRVAQLLKRSEKSRGVTSNGTKYSVPYTMQSGWPDTSAGDTLVNVALKYNAHGFGRKWISIICGDDSVTVTTDREILCRGGLEAIRKTYEDLGMEVEMLKRVNPLDVEFCSGRFYPTRAGYVLMPKPGKLIAKLGYDMVNRPRSEWAPWLRSISSTCLTFGHYDPCLKALGVSLRRLLGEGRQTKVIANQFDKFVDQSDLCSYEQVLDYYSHHYGFCERDLLEVCDEINFSITAGVDTLTGSMLVSMCEHDR